MTEVNEEYKTEIIVENHKGFAVRKCARGFLAFPKTGGGGNLATKPTVEEAIATIDQEIELRRRREADETEWRAQHAKRAAEKAEHDRQKLETVLANIEPIRDFTERLGLNMLRDCLTQLEREEQERNVPVNWEELVEICERITDIREGNAEGGEVAVSKYGVTEHLEHESYGEYYEKDYSYTLQEYIEAYPDEYEKYLEEKEEEKEKSPEA
jgi:hypothetical protein